MPDNTRRNLLHRTKIEDFLTWVRDLDFAVFRNARPYEVARLIKPNQNPIIIYERDQGDHLTTFGEGTALVERWLKERE